MTKHDDTDGVSAKKYAVGFILSVVLTLLAFIPVMCGLLDNWTGSGAVIYLLGLGLIQIVVQIIFFLHLNHGPDAKWNVGTMWFAAVAVFVIIGGTWWAIQHLNYNMMGSSGRVVQPTLIDQAPVSSQPVKAPEAETPQVEAPNAPEANAPGQSEAETPQLEAPSAPEANAPGQSEAETPQLEAPSAPEAGAPGQSEAETPQTEAPNAPEAETPEAAETKTP